MVPGVRVGHSCASRDWHSMQHHHSGRSLPACFCNFASIHCTSDRHMKFYAKMAHRTGGGQGLLVLVTNCPTEPGCPTPSCRSLPGRSGRSGPEACFPCGVRKKTCTNCVTKTILPDHMHPSPPLSNRPLLLQAGGVAGHPRPPHRSHRPGWHSDTNVVR